MMVFGGLNERMIGEQGIDRVDEGEIRIEANVGGLKERLKKQESISAKGTERVKEGIFRGKAVGGVIKGMMAEQRRMNRDREGQEMILRKQERKAGMRVGMNEYKGRSGKEINNERKTEWDKLLGVEGGGRDEY
jgi:hypothetical protein